MKEIWRDSISLFGTHQVSNFGRVKRIPHAVRTSFGRVRTVREKVSDHSPSKNSYKVIHLKRDGKTKTFLHHRLVAEVFCENPRLYPFVNHIDGDRHNNNPNNLEWCTQKQNMQHAHDTGLINCKVSVCSSKDGFGHWYPSLVSASIHTNISKPCICAASKKKQKVAGGMEWNYAPAKGEFAKRQREQNK